MSKGSCHDMGFITVIMSEHDTVVVLEIKVILAVVVVFAAVLTLVIPVQW